MSDKKKKIDDVPGRPTARETLVKLLGQDHADHFPFGVDRLNTAIILRCSCNKHALLDDDDCFRLGLGERSKGGLRVLDSALKAAKEGFRNVQKIPAGLGS